MSAHKLRNWFWIIAVVLILAPLSPLAATQSPSLYGSAAPDDASFVRIFNVSQQIQTVWAGSIQFSGIEPMGSSAYRPVNPGVHAVFVGNAFAELIALDGRFYTVILDSDGPVVYEDLRHTRADQAQIVLYNLTSESLELKTADGSTMVISAVGAGSSGVISVNPVEVELAVFLDSTPIVTIGDIGLSRGQSYAIFVVDSDGELEVIVRQAEVLSE